MDPSAAAAPDSDRAVKAFAFVSSELHGFFGHLAGALESYLGGEELPASLFDHQNEDRKPQANARKQRSDKGTKRTRKPNAFNIFVKRKIEELKEQGYQDEDGHKGLFKTAVEEWGKLTKAQQIKFTEDYKAEIQATELEAGTPAPAGDDDDVGQEDSTPEPSPDKAPAAAALSPVSLKVERVDGEADAAAAADVDDKKKKRHSRGGEGGADGDKKKKKRKKRDKSIGSPAAQ